MAAQDQRRADESALDEEEHFHFQRVVGSFTCYERAANADAERTRRAAARLHPRLAALLPDQCLSRRVRGPRRRRHRRLQDARS